MKILHICIATHFTEKYSYQENELPKKHAQLGNIVKIVCGQLGFNASKKPDDLTPTRKIIDNGIELVRLEYVKSPFNILKKLKVVKKLYSEIKSFDPDIIFVHGIQFWGFRQVYRYKKKNRRVKVFADNHADYINTPVIKRHQKILHRCIYGSIARKFVPYIEKYWGVTQMREEYLHEMYDIPYEKIGLLVMGGDETKINFDSRDTLRKAFCDKFNIPSNFKIIVTGGKIERRKNIHLLIKAMKDINNAALVIFGEILDDIYTEFWDLLKSTPNVVFVGWIPSDEAYNYFVFSDLAVFPGNHSVLWEQAVACGIPTVFKYFEGITHIDLGGNAIFLHNDDSQEISNTINNIFNDEVLFEKMRNTASLKGCQTFAYINIAKRSIGQI